MIRPVCNAVKLVFLFNYSMNGPVHICEEFNNWSRYTIYAE